MLKLIIKCFFISIPIGIYLFWSYYSIKDIMHNEDNVDELSAGWALITFASIIFLIIVIIINLINWAWS